jgi:signal transduction histidine kinase
MRRVQQCHDNRGLVDLQRRAREPFDETKRGVSLGLSNALLGAFVVLGVAGTTVTFVAVRSSAVLADPKPAAVLRALWVASYFAVGLYTWHQRPRRLLGPLLLAVGVVQALEVLNVSADPVASTFGRLMNVATQVLLVYLFVSFPHDRPRPGFDRWFVLVYMGATAVVWALVVVIVRTLPAGGAFTDCAQRCPANGLRLIDSSAEATHTINLAVTVITAAVLVFATGLVAAHGRATARLLRRAIAPVLAGLIFLSLSYVLSSVLAQADPTGNRSALRVLAAVGALGIPIAFFVGQVRGRSFAIASLGRLIAQAADEPISTARAQDLIRDALGDPDAQLLLRRRGDAWPDLDPTGGQEARLPDRSEASVIPIDRDGESVGAVVYRTAALEDIPLVQTLATASAMLLENTRLLRDLHASRARIATIADEERRRIERDLHDGSQQQLVAIQVRLSLLLDRIDEPLIASDLQRVILDTDVAISQLRALARGIYPDVLTTGLAPALKAAARDAPLPASVIDNGVGRASAEIEAAIYFSGLEALQNAAKHSGPAAHVTITLDRTLDGIEFAITDDGVGFDTRTSSAGRGLSNMHDRITAVGGTLIVVSAPEHGTTVRGTVPLAVVSEVDVGARDIRHA